MPLEIVNGVFVNSTFGAAVRGASTNGYSIQGGSNSGVTAFFQSNSPSNTLPTVQIEQAATSTADLLQTTAGGTHNVTARITSGGVIGGQSWRWLSSVGATLVNFQVGTSLPVSGMVQGDLFFRTDTGLLYSYNAGAWGAAAAGVGLMAAVAIPALTASTTLGITQHIVKASASLGAVTLTLPSASAGCREYWVTNVGASGTVTIAAAGSDTINGATTVALTAQYNFAHIISDGAALWMKM